MEHDELPFGPDLITLALTDSQSQQLRCLIRRQVTDRKGLLSCSVAPFISSENGETHFRLQAAFIPWKTANKVLKIIRDAKNGQINPD